MKPLNIIGGGLWGGLFAYKLQKLRPEVDYVLYEKGATFGGNHTWSFHKSDVSSENFEMLKPFLVKEWKEYEVIFPEYRKTIPLSYCSISSENFNDVLMKSIPESRRKLSTNKTVLPEEIDARGICSVNDCGFQKFVGLEIETASPHGLTTPILMDASVEQIDGFRFMYVLPFSETTILFEDTVYSNNPELADEIYTSRIYSYIEKMGFSVSRVVRTERGVLPIPFSKRAPSSTGIDLSEIFHETTGYSLPDALRVTDLMLSSSLNPDDLKQVVQNYRDTRSSSQRFFCFLNKTMFKASSDKDRYKTLQFFYRSPITTIIKFYSGQMGQWDQLKFFIGKPPVSVMSVLKSFWSDRPTKSEVLS